VPHFSIEYSANLDQTVDMMEICGLVSRTILETGLFEMGAVRVRAFRAEAYAIADGLAVRLPVAEAVAFMRRHVDDVRDGDHTAAGGRGRAHPGGRVLECHALPW